MLIPAALITGTLLRRVLDRVRAERGDTYCADHPLLVTNPRGRGDGQRVLGSTIGMGSTPEPLECVPRQTLRVRVLGTAIVAEIVLVTVAALVVEGSDPLMAADSATELAE